MLLHPNFIQSKAREPAGIPAIIQILQINILILYQNKQNFPNLKKKLKLVPVVIITHLFEQAPRYNQYDIVN